MKAISKHKTPFALAAIASVATAAILAGCGGSDDNSAATGTVPNDISPTPTNVPSKDVQAAARSRIFGAENVDPDTGEVRSDLLIVSWLTNTTYAAAINGKVVLLDASLLRRETSVGRTPATLDDIAALMPSYILLGKADAGHADLAAAVAFRAGATVIGAAEHCDVVENDARKEIGYTGSQKLIKCDPVVPRAQAVGKAVNTKLYPDLGVCLRAVSHSDAVSAERDSRLPVEAFDWSANSDVRDPTYWPAGTPAQDNVATTGTGGPNVLYHLAYLGSQSFGLTWNDRVGSLKEAGSAVAGLLRGLPKTDLQIGAVDVGNAATNGLRDAALYVQAVEPKIFFMAGHDAAAQRAGAFNTAETVRRALDKAIDVVGMDAASRPELRVNFDPSDYAKAHFMTFDPTAPTWSRAGDRIASTSCE